MSRTIRIFACITAVATASLLAHRAGAETIINMTLGADPPADVQFNGLQLSTINDGQGATTGNQNTRIEFLGFLDGISDILSPPGSFTLSGMQVSAPATTFANLVIQPFTGGTFSIYDASNVLLLSGTLDDSTLTGTIGPPATGSVFTATFGTFTGGTLASQLVPDSLGLSMTLTGVSGNGFHVADEEVLQAFNANATISISALQIPEPSTITLALLGTSLTLSGAWAARRRAGKVH